MVRDIEEAIATVEFYFPYLRESGQYKVTSNKTNRYNCIAWAMRLTDRWVDTVQSAGHWWPNDKLDHGRQGLIHAFESLRFSMCTDNNRDLLYDKVALYFNPYNNRWSHAARIINETDYHSKLGEGWDIHHSAGEKHLFKKNDNNTYGFVYAIMKRPKIYRVVSYWLMIKMIFENIVNLIKY